MLAQDAVRHEQHDHGAIHDVAMLIDGKHAVGIAIESRAEIGSDFQYFLLQRHQVLRFNGARRVVGKSAIQFKVERDEMRGQVLKDTRHHHPSHAITGINSYFEGANLADVIVLPAPLAVSTCRTTLIYRSSAAWS